jgi:hypothetical protein
LLDGLLVAGGFRFGRELLGIGGEVVMGRFFDDERRIVLGLGRDEGLVVELKFVFLLVRVLDDKRLGLGGFGTVFVGVLLFGTVFNVVFGTVIEVVLFSGMIFDIVLLFGTIVGGLLGFGTVFEVVLLFGLV